MASPTDFTFSSNYFGAHSAETPRRYAFAAEDAATLQHWQRALRAELVDRLGINRIAARCTASPVATKRGEVRLDDHIREHWEIWTEPGMRVPFFLLRPIEVDAPRPLVLCPHGHNKRGRFDYAGITTDDNGQTHAIDGDRDIALQAVRQGYVAVAPEARAFGESRFEREVKSDSPHSCITWQSRALMFGRTLIGERVWDIMRLIDYAATRPDIDTSRIVITGNSGGGTVTLFAAAVETRISIAVPGAYFCTFADSIGSIHHCPCNYFPGMMELAEMPEIAGLIAPRPFLAVNGKDDPIFPIRGTQAAFEQLKRIYTVAGAADRCELYIGDGGHRYFAEPVWPFVSKWLGC